MVSPGGSTPLLRPFPMHPSTSPAPTAPNSPLDPASVEAFKSDEECIKFLADETVKSKLATAKKISAVSAKVKYSYDYAVFLGKLMRGRTTTMKPTSNSRP